MKKGPGRPKKSEAVIRDIKRRTRRQFNPEEKIAIVLEGAKTKEKDAVNSKLFDQRHVEIGIASLKQLINNGETIRHLVF